MRFTKIPLIATLMAVALSLLIVLPTLAQVSGDRTDGRLSVGSWIDVRVADNIEDITDDTATVAGETVPVIDGAPTHATGATAFDAKDTYFNGSLYISNNEDAYNTILITAAVRTGDLAPVDDTTATPPVDVACDAGVSAAVATIRNDRSGTKVTAYLASTGGADTTLTDRTIYQGIAVVWDQEDAIEGHNGPCGAAPVMTNPEEYAGSEEQSTEAQLETGYTSLAVGTPASITTQAELEAAQQRFIANFVGADNQDGWTSASGAVIPARDGDTLTITVDGVSGSIRLVVDGDEPEIEDIVPASGGTQNSSTVNLGFTVSDDGAGIRYDGESGTSGDPDLQPRNGDGDQRFDEPLTSKGAGPDNTLGTTDDVAGNGSTADITINFGTTDDFSATGDGDVSQYGSNDWTQRVKGVSYDLDMRLVGKPFDKYYWQVTAKDRVGNSVTTDSDEDTSEDEPFSFTVDNASPEVVSARTGIGYEAGDGEFKNRSWIALNFENEDEGGADRIDAGTVEPGDFTVEGHTVVNVVVPDDKKICKRDIIDPVNDPDNEEKEDAKNITAFDAPGLLAVAAADAIAADPTASPPVEAMDAVLEEKAAPMCDFEPRARIYLELADALDSDETPTIQLLGGVLKDIAGNNNVTQSLENVQDKIAPGVSITITSSSGATGRTATDKDGSFTVRVTSDEDLRTFPELFFATMEGEADIDEDGKAGAASGLTIASVDDGNSLTEKEANVWEKKFDADSIEGSGDDRIVAVIITAEDEERNSGNSAGWKGSGTPAAGQGLDFKKLDAGGFLLEVDSDVPEATVTVLPSVNPDVITDQTESSNPYIQIEFKEANEYGIPVTDDKGTTSDEDTWPDGAASDYDPTDDDETGTAYSVDIGDGDTARTDSHRSVAISALTLNGEDRLSEVVQVDPWEYVLAVTGLEVGDYTIVYTANDDVGNEVEDVEEEFEVLERQPYDITLQPGWNLISFPGDPFNPAVGNVIGSDLKADTVLGYQGGEWVTAVKNEDGRWQGTLVDIQGGYGYWVRTTAVEDIETVIPPILPTSNLPTVPVISGWNLLGVVDAEQDDAGTEHDADEYFTSLSVWRVAYSFETQLNQWTKLLPDGGDADNPHVVENGKGYWVWSTRPGTLVP